MGGMDGKRHDYTKGISQQNMQKITPVLQVKGIAIGSPGVLMTPL